MNTEKEHMLRIVEARALQEAEYLAGEFARAASEDREAILAALEFEQWLAAGCRDIADHRARRKEPGR